MKTSPWSLYLTCLVLGETAAAQTSDVDVFVHQEERFMSVKVGGNLTLRCSYNPDVATRFFWYKQILGQKLSLLSSFYKYDKDAALYSEFNNPRFAVDTKYPKNCLNISDLQTEDSGTYYCAGSYSNNFDFGQGTIVSVEGSGLDVQTLVRQPESQSVHPGDSVTLNCTVQTKTCDGELSVYWFKQSEDPQPGILYTHGGGDEQCKKKNHTQTHTCVYNLDVDYPHDGTYYCAVASCGHITFGNGTQVDFKDKFLVLMYFLSGALGFTTILVVSLSVLVCKMRRKTHSNFIEPQSRPSANPEVHPDADSLHYAALSVKTSNTSRRQRDTSSNDCVYSSLKK